MTAHAAAASGFRAHFWLYNGPESELERLCARTRSRAAPLFAAGKYEAACAVYGLHAENVSGSGANCFFHAMLRHDAQRGRVPIACSALAAETLRCNKFAEIEARRLLRARTAGSDGTEEDALLATLSRVRAYTCLVVWVLL